MSRGLLKACKRCGSPFLRFDTRPVPGEAFAVVGCRSCPHKNVIDPRRGDECDVDAVPAGPVVEVVELEGAPPELVKFRRFTPNLICEWIGKRPEAVAS